MPARRYHVRCALLAVLLISTRAYAQIPLQPRLDIGIHDQLQFSDVITPNLATGGAPTYLNRAIESCHVAGSSNGLNTGVSWTGTIGWAASPVPDMRYGIDIEESQYRFDTPIAQGDFEQKNLRFRSSCATASLPEARHPP